MALSQRRLPVVLSLWGTDLYGSLGLVSRACVPFCDAVVVMSDRMATDLDQNCDVIPHGVNLNRFRPEPQSSAQEAVGWDDGDFHVLFPYRAWREIKNYPLAERVVDAASEILSRNVHLEVVIDVPHEEFPQYLNAADCLILSSRWEGSPNSVKEAMACNLPVVALDVGDVRERLDGVEPSAVCTSESELVSALVEVLRRGERSNGRENAHDVSMEWMGQQLRQVYERVLAEGEAGTESVVSPESVPHQ